MAGDLSIRRCRLIAMIALIMGDFAIKAASPAVIVVTTQSPTEATMPERIVS